MTEAKKKGARSQAGTPAPRKKKGKGPKRTQGTHRGQGGPPGGVVQEPAVQVQGVGLATPGGALEGRYWPEGKPLPVAYRKPRPVPCMQCRRVRLEDGGQAVVCTNQKGDLAYFRCKGCGHRFKLAVE